jgi:tellurite resistance protein TerC
MGFLFESLNFPLLGHSAWLWLAFAAVIIGLLIFDLRMVNGQEREASLRENVLLSSGYIGIALLFGAFVWWQLGAASGTAYFAGYLIEKLLSIDNLFVIAMIFGFLAIPSRYHHRVLFWGILGAVVLRALLIAIGATLVSEYLWVLYLFGAFLLFTGIKMWISGNRPRDISDSSLFKFLRRRLRMTVLTGDAFFVRSPDPKTNRLVRHATPLFVALCLVEFADVAFALDSIPAVFAITTDPFVVFTSNIFAILGLRSLYFVLGAMVERFEYLRHALALILIYIGGKVLLADVLGEISPSISLLVTVLIIVGGVLASLWKERVLQRQGKAHG